MLAPGPNPTIQRREDGTVWALDPFPEVLAISRDLLEQVDPTLLQRGEDVVDIRLANGRWVYRIAEWQDGGRTAVCVLQYHEEGSGPAQDARGRWRGGRGPSDSSASILGQP